MNEMNSAPAEDKKSGGIELPSGKITYLLAFIIPIIVIVSIYVARKIYPFGDGDKCYLRSDMYHQYAPFFSELWNKLAHGGSMTYSWNMGLGVNFTALYAYYLSCPLNWFIFLFPQKNLIEVMNVLIILKLALASLSCTFYITRMHNTKNVTACTFGIFYALSGYVAAYCWNIMWLDCIILLPLIVLGLTRLVRENKCFLYCISLGLAILSNYYISIMICLFLIVYFIVLMVSFPKTTLKDYGRKFLNFCVYSLLAGGLAAILLIPELYALSYTVSSKISFPKTLSCYFPIMKMLIRHLSNVEVHIGLEHYPNIYCGVGAFLLLPLYIMNDRIDTREKVGKCIILLIFLLSFNLNVPNFIWHGLHFPNSLPCRQSFIYVFVLLTMCYDALKDILYFDKRQLTCALFTAIGFIIIAEQAYSGEYDFKIFYISGGFILFYMFLMYLYRSKKAAAPVFIFLFFLSTVLECALNLEHTGFSTTGRSYYLSDVDSVRAINEYISERDESFYRMEKYTGYRTKNDNAWHNYRGVSYFSSTAHGGITSLMGKLGCEHSTNAYGYNGATVLTSAMLGVKYIFSDAPLRESSLLTYNYSNDNRYLYRLKHTLPVGFMVGADINEMWDTASTNPFIVQNSFLYYTTAVSDVFTSLPTAALSNSSVQIYPSVTQHVYIQVLSNVDSVNVYIDDQSKNYNLKHEYLIDIGVVDPDMEIRVTSDNGSENISILAYTVDEDKFIKAIDMLNEEGYNVTDYGDNYLSGNISVKNSGILFTSIPYDKGWSVLVDGKKAEIIEIKEALLGVKLQAGEHTLEFRYLPEGYSLGIAITVLCIVILLAIYLLTDNNYIKIQQKINEKRRNTK